MVAGCSPSFVCEVFSIPQNPDCQLIGKQSQRLKKKYDRRGRRWGE